LKRYINVASWGRTSNTPSEGTPLCGYTGISAGNVVRFDIADVSLRQNEAIQMCGEIYLLNTIESFKKCEKNAFLNGDCGDKETDDPNGALVPSICLTYYDLKSNMTVYWFTFPALTHNTDRVWDSAVSQSFRLHGFSKPIYQFRVAQERIQYN
jgi:hypothetical protein